MSTLKTLGFVLAFVLLGACDKAGKIEEVQLRGGKIKTFVPTGLTLKYTDGPDFELVRVVGLKQGGALFYLGNHPQQFLLKYPEDGRLGTVEGHKEREGLFERERIQVVLLHYPGRNEPFLLQSYYHDIGAADKKRIDRLFDKVTFVAEP